MKADVIVNGQINIPNITQKVINNDKKDAEKC